MSRVFKLDVSESQEELELLLKKEKDARRRERLQFLYWYKTGQVTTRKALGELLIPNTTKEIHYIVGSTLIFSKASETNSIAVKEAKNSFDFDWNR